MFTEMRRKDRQLSEEETKQILREGKYGVLSTVGENGYPYGVPLNYAYENGKIYFHGTAEGGLKTANIRFNPKASFTVVGKTELPPGKFATKYESIIAFGTVRVVENKKEVLEKKLRKYSADFMESGEKYAKAMLEKVSVYELNIEHLTGKARKNG